MPRPTYHPRHELFQRLSAEGAALRETNDCSIIALAAVTDLPYNVIHADLSAEGRRPRRGAFRMQQFRVLLYRRFFLRAHAPEQFIQRYPAPHNRVLRSVTSHHPDRFPAVWRDGKRYLLYTYSHVLAVVDGANCDWSRGRVLRINSIYEVRAQPWPGDHAFTMRDEKGEELTTAAHLDGDVLVHTALGYHRVGADNDYEAVLRVWLPQRGYTLVQYHGTV